MLIILKYYNSICIVYKFLTAWSSQLHLFFYFGVIEAKMHLKAFSLAVNTMH